MTYNTLREGRKHVNNLIDNLYSEWLLEENKEIIGNDKGKHIDMVCQGVQYDEFEEWLKEV